MAIPPLAPRRPHVITAHGDGREDPWFWLRDREDPEVLAYLEAENTYTDAVMEPLGSLRDGLFEEMKARIKETDMSVPARRGPWWYYSRTEEGKEYAIHCRRPARGRDELPPAGEPGDEEQILLDENSLAQGSEYFAVGSAAVSHDHRWLAYGTDRRGDEKYELRFRPLDAETSPNVAAEVVFETSYGLAWSAGADHVFYVRLDEAQRPYQLWRHQLGTDPAGDQLVFEEPDRRFSLGTGSTPRRVVRAHRAALHQHERVARHPLARADGDAHRGDGAPRGGGVRRRPPDPGGRRRGMVRGADQRPCFGLPGPRRTGHGAGSRRVVARGRPAPPGGAHRGRRRVLHRAGAERARRGRDEGPRAPAARRGRRRPGRRDPERQPLRRRPAGVGLGHPFGGQPVLQPGSAPTPNRTHRYCESAGRRW